MKASPSTRIYTTSIYHARKSPVQHRFRNRSYTWLVDLDDLPRLGALERLASFESRDHLGSPERSLRENLDTFLATQDVDLDGGQILMLTMPRVLGTVFNPISVYWCHTPDGRLACNVVEVHNTYGDRHASPFNDVAGSYRLTIPTPGHKVHVAVVLDRPGQDPFVASLRGRALPTRTSTVVRLALTQPLEPLAVAARIRWHGIRLWLRHLPVQSRPSHHQEAVQ